LAIRKPSLILASASPRREQLLMQAGYKFRVHPSNIEESEFGAEGLEPREYAEELALAKAKDVAQNYPDSLVIGADTIAEVDGRVIGKPADAGHAEEIVRLLFSRPHKVTTGVAIVRAADGVEIVGSDTTVVYPRKMSEEQIAEHIAGGSWEGKAGAYAIQETGDEFVERIEGSLTNVMGMPMKLVERLLRPLLK
jgi:septum formation protein